MTEQSINLERMEEAASLFGPFDENIRIIERELHVQIVVRDDELKISGDGEQVMYCLLYTSKAGPELLQKANRHWACSRLHSCS